MSSRNGDARGISRAALHGALFETSRCPTVVADRLGTVIEWNRAAVTVTGISREEALESRLWELQARLAPAHIPYEQALVRAHETFDEMIRRASTDTRWRRSFETELLSMHGSSCSVRSEVYPLRIDDELAIVGTVRGVRDLSSDDSGDTVFLLGRLERLITSSLDARGTARRMGDRLIGDLDGRVRNSDRAPVRLDRVLDQLVDLWNENAGRTAVELEAIPLDVRLPRAVETALLVAESVSLTDVLDHGADSIVAIELAYPEHERISISITAPASAASAYERRWTIEEIVDRLGARYTIESGQTARLRFDLPAAIAVAHAFGVATYE
jgi:PAS domain S-box-containing protein